MRGAIERVRILMRYLIQSRSQLRLPLELSKLYNIVIITRNIDQISA